MKGLEMSARKCVNCQAPLEGHRLKYCPLSACQDAYVAALKEYGVKYMQARRESVRSIAIKERLACKVCHGRIPDDTRLDAVYCSRKCRNRAARDRAAIGA